MYIWHIYFLKQNRLRILGQSWLWLYGSWIYNYLCNQCLSPLMLWVRILIRARCTTCDRSVIFSTNKTDCHDITEILLKVALNTIKQTNRLCIHSIAERQKHLTSSILAIISPRTNSTIKCLIVMRQFSFYL